MGLGPEQLRSHPVVGSHQKTNRGGGVGSGGVELVACTELLKAFLFDLSDDTKVRLSKFIHYGRTTTKAAKETSAALCGSRRSQNRWIARVQLSHNRWNSVKCVLVGPLEANCVNTGESGSSAVPTSPSGRWNPEINCSLWCRYTHSSHQALICLS